jgi:SAM-dependent methyltransferase
MDIFHKIFLVARQNDSPYGGLHQRPLPIHPRVLDLGCGTGIWAIDMAECVTSLLASFISAGLADPMVFAAATGLRPISKAGIFP